MKTKYLILGLLVLNCSTSTESESENKEYKSTQTITRYWELGLDSVKLLQSDTLETVQRDSYWFNSLKTLKITGSTCEAIFKDIWWDYDYGDEDSALVKGRFENNSCGSFGDGRYSGFQIETGNQKVISTLRYFSIQYDSVLEPGVRLNKRLEIGLNRNESVQQMKQAIDSLLKSKDFYDQYYELKPRPDMYDAGIRVWYGHLYETITELEKRDP